MEERYRTPSVITNDKEWKEYLGERLKSTEKYQKELSTRIESGVFEHSNIAGNETDWKIYLNESFNEAVGHIREESKYQKKAREIRETISNDKKWRRYLYQRMEELKKHKQVFT